MPILKSPLEKAKAELEAAQAVQARWTAEANAKAAELADLERRVGDEVLADETAAGRLVEQMAALRSARQIAEQAAAAAGLRVVPARLAVRKAEAGKFRADAADLRRQAAKRQERTDRLLAELFEHEGCTYGPRAIIPDGTYIEAHMKLMDEPPTSRTAVMLADADRLDEQARAIEAEVAEQEAAVRPRRPSAGIQVVGSGVYRSARVGLSATAGIGSVTFTVTGGAREHQLVLPDERGRLGVDLDEVGLSPKGGVLRVLADGQEIAAEPYPALTAVSL